jgi:hypothetical protein
MSSFQGCASAGEVFALGAIIPTLDEPRINEMGKFNGGELLPKQKY